MTTRALGLFLLVLLVVLPVARAEDEAAVVTRLYDVGPFVHAGPAPRVEILGLPPGGQAFVTGEEDEEEPVAFLSGDTLVELVLSSVHGRWGDDERAVVSFEGRQLLVRAPEAVQGEIRRLLGALWLAATQRITVEGHRLEFDDEGRAALQAQGLVDVLRRGRLDAKARKAVLAVAGGGGGDLSAASTVVRPGGRGTLGRVRSTAYVRDYEVEIAQDSRVGDPWVETVETGWFADVTPHLLQDGSFFLDVLVQTASLEEPLRRQPLEAEPFGTVDLPACRVLRLCGAARVQPGEALVFTAAPHGSRGPLEVVMLAPGLRGERVAMGGIVRFDVSALTALPTRWGLATESENLEGVPDAGALNPPRFVRHEPYEPVASEDALMEEIASTLGDEVWEREGAWLAPWGRALTARHEPNVLEGIAKVLSRREHALAAGRLTVRLVARPADGEEEILAHASLACPHGRVAVWQSGVERAYVADWDVEVAQEARSGDPLIGTVFGGLTLEARLEAAPLADRFALDLALGWADLEPRMETRRTHNECTGVVDIPRLSRVDLRIDLVLVPGATQRYDAGTLEDGRRLLVEVTLER